MFCKYPPDADASDRFNVSAEEIAYFIRLADRGDRDAAINEIVQTTELGPWAASDLLEWFNR